ncbi:MAG TPA: hypothetical protein VN608_09285 [Clostridia bacterium]|nr:hypothetical protein [Clostridia bacterium]
MLYKIKLALRALGVNGWKTAYLATIPDNPFVVEVYVDSKYFGLWDTVKNTFVE